MSGGKPFLIHAIFQRHGIAPDEVYNKPRKVQQFMYASMMLVFEEEERERKRIESLRQRGG